MIILHASALSWERIDGLCATIPPLIAAQNRLDGVRAALLNTNRCPGPTRGPDFPVFPRGKVLARSDGLCLPPPFDHPDLVVIHSTYLPFHAILARRLRQLEIPYLLCPHGGMTRGAQRFRWWKKRLGNLLFFRQLAAHARAVHYLTTGEAESSIGWNRPMFVVGNGITLPPETQLASPGRSDEPHFTFIGRLHVETKGLDLIVQGCRRLRSELLRARARVRLYGPDELQAARVLATWIARFGLHDVVTLAGPVTGDVKTAALKSSDVFLQASRHEGCPVGILEALAHGLPCLLTPGTNLAETVAAAGAGWRVEPTPAGIADGLRHVLRAPKSVLQQAGVRARRLAEREFRWDQIAAQVVEHYRHYARPAGNLRERAAA